MSQDIESYYQSVSKGGLACVHHRDPTYGDQFIFARIIEISSGKVVTAYGVFWAVNGERCDQRWRGDANQLVVPTIARLEMAEARLSNLYQFGTDRKFELVAARAVLERRLSKMPDTPPPPIPTLDEAEAELHAAAASWLAVDRAAHQPGDSVRIHREASERLATARINVDRARKAQMSRSEAERTSQPLEILDPGKRFVFGADGFGSDAPSRLSSFVKKTLPFEHRAFDTATYTVNIAQYVQEKRRGS